MAFHLAQARGFGFQFVSGFFDLLGIAHAAGFGILLVYQPQQMLRGVALRFQFAVLFGDLGLFGQMGELLFQFQANVVHAQQILARIADAQFGFAAAVAVFGNARRFFEEDAQFLRLGLDDARDHALLDDGVSARTQPGAEENIGDVLAPHVLVVDVIAGIAVALQHALDGNLGVARPLPGGLAQAVVENQLDAGARHRLALAGAVENHVLHGFAAQRGGPGFAQHPAQRVDYIRLAATVGADDADELPRQGDMRRINEGL